VGDLPAATAAYLEARRWAEPVDNRLALAQAAAFLAQTAAEAEPIEALEWFRAAIIDLSRGGDWGHGQWVLKSSILPLARLGRQRNAARALGALDWLFPYERRAGGIMATTRSALVELLGDAEFETLMESGRTLDRRELVQLILDEIAGCRPSDRARAVGQG